VKAVCAVCGRVGGIVKAVCAVCGRVGGIVKTVCALCCVGEIWWKCEDGVCCVLCGVELVEL
jgi:hypothetical protein